MQQEKADLLAIGADQGAGLPRGRHAPQVVGPARDQHAVDRRTRPLEVIGEPDWNTGFERELTRNVTACSPSTARAAVTLAREFWLPDFFIGLNRDYATEGPALFTTGIAGLAWWLRKRD